MALETKGKQQNINKEIEAISEKVKKTKIKASDLIIPISLGIILILLTLFVFVPMVSAALDYQQEMKDVKGKISTLKSLENTINSIDQNKISDDIVIAKTVVPKVLKVSDFIYYVDSLAISKGLEERELSAGDTNSGQDSSFAVSGPVEYSGSFNKIISFLEEVQSTSPYLVSIKNVELNKSGSSNEWTVSLLVNGYYMADRTDVQIDYYAPFKVYTTYGTIMDIFRTKASQID